MTKPLAKCQVLLVRPVTATQQLPEMLITLGATVIQQPVMKISPVDRAVVHQQLTQYSCIEKAVFISRNAARFGVDLLGNAIFNDTAYYAVGDESANYLAEKGIVAAVPREQKNTEGLLSMPELADVRGDNLVIFAGQNGRDLLRKTLQQRGANVISCALYRRDIEYGNKQGVNQFLSEAKNTVVMLHSSELMDNLLQIVTDKNRETLLNIPIIVPSQRVADKARKVKFTNINLAHSALSGDMVSALQQWYSKLHN